MEGRDATLDGRSAPVTRRGRADARVALCRGAPNRGRLGRRGSMSYSPNRSGSSPASRAKHPLFSSVIIHCAAGNIPADKAGVSVVRAERGPALLTPPTARMPRRSGERGDWTLALGVGACRERSWRSSGCWGCSLEEIRDRLNIAQKTVEARTWFLRRTWPFDLKASTALQRSTFVPIDGHTFPAL